MGKRRGSFVASDDSGEERPAKQSKVSKKSAKGSSSTGGSGVDANGDPYWEVRTKLIPMASNPDHLTRFS